MKTMKMVKGAWDIYQVLWTLESHAQQQLAWEDAQEARYARMRAEEQAARRAQEMLDAHPSGALGHAKLNDEDALRRSGLL